MSLLGSILQVGVLAVATVGTGGWGLALGGLEFSAGALMWGARGLLLVNSLNESRKARRAAKAAQAAADYAARQQSTRSASDAGRIIYGRDVVAGSLRYWQTTGTKGEFLHLVYVMAAHEIDAIETVFFNDIGLPPGDANGFIQSGQFCETKSTEHQRGSRTGAGTITFANAINGITAVTRLSPGASNSVLITTGYSYSGNTVTITDSTAGATFWVDCTYATTVPRVRVQTFLGTDSQTALSDLVSESGGKWTANHRLRGLAGVYIRLEYTPEMFGQIGIPEVRCLIRGKKVYDPRNATTAWSANSALIMRDYLRNYVGATAAEVPDAMVITAANSCDDLITLSVGGSTEARYTCNASYSTEMTPKAILESIGETMACGVPPYAGGQFLILPGVARTPALTITNDMVIGSVKIASETRRSQLVNRVVVTYPEPGNMRVMTEAPPVTNATYLAADNGVDLPLALTIEGSSSMVRAQRLGKIALERARQGLTCEIVTTLDAYDAYPGDWVNVTLDRYGWAAKTFEVQQRTLDVENGRLTYSLREIASGVFDWNYGEATTVDLTPNTALPNPLTPPAALTISYVSATIADNQTVSGLTKLTRALIVWAQSTDVFVLRGGKVEIEWMYTGDTEWNAGLSVPGDDTQAYLGPLSYGKSVLVRIRPVNSIGRVGAWSYKAFLSAPSLEDVPGQNYLMNGDFYIRAADGHPYGWDLLETSRSNTGNAWGFFDGAVGRDGIGRSASLFATGAVVPTYSPGAMIGILSGTETYPGDLVQGGVSGGWRPGHTYAVQFWARRRSGSYVPALTTVDLQSSPFTSTGALGMHAYDGSGSVVDSSFSTALVSAPSPYLTGYDAYASVTNSAAPASIHTGTTSYQSLSSGSFTLEAHFIPGALFEIGFEAGSSTDLFSVSPSSLSGSVLYIYGASGLYGDPTVSFNTGAVNHIAYVVSPSETSVWLNGARVFTGAGSTVSDIGSAGIYSYSGGGGGEACTILTFRISDGALYSGASITVPTGPF